ncbi:Rv0361 family membrane protein [Sinosporangium siamense]|uniref:DUF4878 domain-containing protein n=1 Tax=Sinosporangium siamense TaxID=1367973 RepID=A0A919RK13_9ACTN|nr:hypothetical protein [Sinosporangium siamense]GII95271.1 hypothetical protein Ssi02_55020 [Sinosporangium siamense]
MDPQTPSPDPPLLATPPARRGKLLLIGALIVAVAVAVVVASGLFRTQSGTSPSARAVQRPGEAEIRSTVERFAHAVDREDTVTMIAMLCEEEAQSVADEVSSSGDQVLDRSHERPIDVSDIRIAGDVATVRVTRPAQQPVTMYLRKESNTWKLCDPERYTAPA